MASPWTAKAIGQAFIVNGGLFLQSTCTVLAQLLSLFLLPFNRALYLSYISYTMRMWSQNLVALVQYFCPTTFVLTCDENCFDKMATEDVFGASHTGLAFPDKIVVMANHQVNRHYPLPDA